MFKLLCNDRRCQPMLDRVYRWMHCINDWILGFRGTIEMMFPINDGKGKEILCTQTFVEWISTWNVWATIHRNSWKRKHNQIQRIYWWPKNGYFLFASHTSQPCFSNWRVGKSVHDKQASKIPVHRWSVSGQIGAGLCSLLSLWSWFNVYYNVILLFRSKTMWMRSN